MVLQNLRLNYGLVFCIPLTVSVVLSSAIPFPSAVAATTAFSHHRRLVASSPTMTPPPQFQSPVVPPVAKKVEHAMEMFGDVRIDNYYWLRDDSRTDPEVLSYLREENAYTDSIMSGANPIFLILFRFHLIYLFVIFNFIFFLMKINTIRISMQV